MVFILSISFTSCEKESKSIKPSAQIVYPISNGKQRFYNWFINKDEIGFFQQNEMLLPNDSIPIINFNRIGFNSKTGKFSNYILKTDINFYYLNPFVNANIIQLNENLYLIRNTITAAISQTINQYYEYYLTDKNLNIEEKVTFVFSTHDASISEYATSIYKLRDGKIEKRI
jgi:hypothetical protein